MRSGLRVSLVIPTLNAGPLLEEVLQAVARQPDAAERAEFIADCLMELQAAIAKARRGGN